MRGAIYQSFKALSPPLKVPVAPHSPHSSRAVLAVRVPYIMDQVFALI